MQKADYAEPVARRRVVFCEVVDRAAHVLRSSFGRQRLHEVASLVHLIVTGELAAVDVGRERGEPRLQRADRRRP